jgi:hypothetical protein
MWLTLQRTRDWSFELSVSRGVMAGSTALLAAGAYLVLISGAGLLLRFFGGSWGRALESALVFAALLLLVAVGMSGTFRAKLRVLVAKNFFTYRYDYREEWLRFTSTLSSGAVAEPWRMCRALEICGEPGRRIVARMPTDRPAGRAPGLPADPTRMEQGDALPAFFVARAGCSKSAMSSQTRRSTRSDPRLPRGRRARAG